MSVAVQVQFEPIPMATEECALCIHYGSDSCMKAGNDDPNNCSNIGLTDFVPCALWAYMTSPKCFQGDHDLECKADIGPDSGSEYLYCTKCGWEQRIIYY